VATAELIIDSDWRKILWDNAAHLYRIEEPPESWRRSALAELATEGSTR
jgi:hypothetical protein